MSKKPKRKKRKAKSKPFAFSDGPCFICGGPASVTDWEDPHNKEEYRCVSCSVDEMFPSEEWWERMLDSLVRKKKARLVLQEMMSG